MNLRDQAIKDMVKITSNKASGFAVSLTFQAPNGGPVLVVNGLATDHHMSFETEGTPLMNQNAHCSVALQLLTLGGYPYRNDKQAITFRDHQVSWADALGVVAHYVVTSWHPDKTLGLCTFFLRALDKAV